MGGSSKTSTSTASKTNVNETNLQDSGGITATGSSRVTYQSYSPTFATDAGAVQAGASVANHALDANTSAVDQATSAAKVLGSESINSGTQIATRGLANAQAAYQSGLTFGSSALDMVRSLADQFSTQNAQLTSDALSGYQSIAQQNSASSSTQMQKIALMALAGAVIMVMFAHR